MSAGFRAFFEESREERALPTTETGRFLVEFRSIAKETARNGAVLERCCDDSARFSRGKETRRGLLERSSTKNGSSRERSASRLIASRTAIDQIQSIVPRKGKPGSIRTEFDPGSIKLQVHSRIHLLFFDIPKLESVRVL